MRLRHFVDLVHLQQRDRLDRRSRQAALDVADDRAAATRVDGHAHHRVDDRQRIRARLDAPPRVLADVGLIGRELGDQRFLRDPAARRYHLRRHVGIVAERDAALLDVGTGDVDLDRVDGRLVEQARDLGVFLHGGAGHVGDETRLGEIQRRQDAAHDVLRARVLQADGVQHSGRCLVNAVRRIAEPRRRASCPSAPPRPHPGWRSPGSACIPRRSRRSPRAARSARRSPVRRTSAAGNSGRLLAGHGRTLKPVHSHV